MGCGNADLPLVQTKVVRIETPLALRYCKDQPSVPIEKASDRDLASFIQDTMEAGDDCRDKMHRRNQIEDAGQ